jgi:hypothetical protein
MDPVLVDELSGRMLGIAREVFGDTLTAMIVKGSAIKGDFIPDFSDFDLHVFASNSVMRGPLVPDATIAIPFQDRFSRIDVSRYRVSQIQVMMISAQNHPPDWIPPLPGTFRLIHGELPDSLPEVTDDLLRMHAASGLRSYTRWVDTLLARIVDKPDDQLADSVRLAGTIMKAGLYEAAIVLGTDPRQAWYLPLRQILDIVEPALFPERIASRYFGRAVQWASVREHGPELRTMLADSLTVLDVLSALPDLPVQTNIHPHGA